MNISVRMRYFTNTFDDLFSDYATIEEFNQLIFFSKHLIT